MGCCRCHQVCSRQGHCWNHHKGRTKGTKEEITRWTTVLGRSSNHKQYEYNINIYYNDIQRRKLQRFRIREDHAKEFNVKLVKLTSFLLYLLHSLHKFDIYFHRKEFRRISRPNSLLNTCFFSF